MDKNEVFDMVLSQLPQKQQDALKLARMEGEEVALKFATAAKESGNVLSVEVDGEVFINSKAISAVVSQESMKALLGSATQQDYSRLVVGLGDIIRGSEVYLGLTD